MSAAAVSDQKGGILQQISDLFFARPKLLTLLLLLPPLLWIGIVYVGSLFALLLQSFYSLDDFSGLIVHEFTLSTYAQLLEEANIQIILRTVLMSALVTLACSIIAFPIAYYAARYARGWTKAFFYLAVMMPLWSSYLVKVYAWKLILAKEGIVTWLASSLHLTWLVDGVLALPVVGGPSLSFSYIGTFLVFVYIWIPYMILPIQAALERVPANYHRSVRRSRRRSAPDILDGHLSLGAARHHRRLDLHLLADARRLHHSADCRQFAPLHRPGRLYPAGHRRKYPVGGGFHRGADGDHGRLSLDGQAHGGLRCPLTPIARHPWGFGWPPLRDFCSCICPWL